MRIGIVGAMPEEVASLRLDLRLKREWSRGLRSYAEGTIEGRDVVLVASRWGKVAAASTVTTLVDRFGVDLVVFTGVAGAAAARLRVGDVVVAEDLVQHDMDASAVPDLERFEIPMLGVKALAVEPHLRRCAEIAASAFLREDLPHEVPAALRTEFGIDAPTVVTGTVASGDCFMHDPERVRELRTAIPRLACFEMEGAAAAQVCFEQEVPVVVVRAISDNADAAAAIDFPRFVRDVAATYSRGIVRRFLQGL